ncbi:protein suppressor of variegation 3-7 isoform X2 [Drosophila grimshawi]|uniref:protein suppressor of variegation 3-7 isoform X2 n=1 Tax=Drosophila grimshawi TaxID=7222 RepID=UPI000C871428|nr:protein suppressor of variegation 3-7 isoform X2 [Drosophila grimshawi]
MATENGQDVENTLGQPGDAGNGNKMASIKKEIEYELKIMEVEGAVVPSEETVTIEVDNDDVDMDGVLLVAEYQTASIDTTLAAKPTDDPLLEDKLSTKTKPSSDGDSNCSYSGPDPMGLLEPIDSSRDVDDNEDDDDDDSFDEVSSAGSGSRRISRPERWQIWMKRWRWLLHEECDGDYGFCLYCNVAINVNRNLKNIQQHNMSLYHQERENNYLSFKSSEAQVRNSCSDNEVKHEFGTDIYVAAMKQKRASEVETFNNFNWQRWLNWHQWLERVQNDGTIGLCKYCNVRMNVEFVYLRKRHETSKGHCEAQRSAQEKSSRKRKRSVSQDAEQIDPERPNSNNNNNNKTQVEDPIFVVGASVESTDPSDFWEALPDTNPAQCRCKLCDCRMAVTSFMRHLKTKVHCSNLSSQKRKLMNLNRGIWAKYADQHPWLVADPRDETLAYCHVCCRRFMYGHSEIKRKNHENSEKHQAALVAAATATAGEDAEEAAAQSEPEQFGVRSESDDDDADYIEEDDKLSTSSRSSVERAKTAQVESHQAEPVVRHFSWLRFTKDRKIQMCKYCRVRFYNESSKLRHEHSVRHKNLSQQFKARQAAQLRQARKQRRRAAKEGNVDKGDEVEEVQSNATVEIIQDNDVEPSSSTVAKQKPEFRQTPPTMRGKVLMWKERFPWLSYKRSEQRTNYGWCKLCEVSVYLSSFKYASKHQRSARHVRLRFERKRAARQMPSTDATISPVTLTTGEAKNKVAMAELQAKYEWLEPDASDENYCHCKICDTRLPIKVFFLRQHDGSRKHVDQLERLRIRSQTEGGTLTATGEAKPAAAAAAYGIEDDQETDEALSVNPPLRSECSTEEQLLSKRMRRSLEVRRILRVLRGSMGKRGDERSQLDMAKDMICSSFEIVSRLRTMERENVSRELPASSPSLHHPQASALVLPTQPRDTIDLFLESISQTMKNLPADLAAEGKAKIMQIVCDLELRGMQRTTAQPAPVTPPPPPAITVQAKETPVVRQPLRSNSMRSTVDEVVEAAAVPCSPESLSSTISVEDLTDEQQTEPANGATINLSEVTVTPKPRTAVTSNPSPTGAAAAIATVNRFNRRARDVTLKVRRLIPGKLQVSAIPDATESVRVVPISKLASTTQTHPANATNAARINGTPHLTQRNGQQQQPNHSSPNAIVKPKTPNSSSPLYTEVTNGTGTNLSGSAIIYRKIRVGNGNGNGNGTKVITFQKQQATPSQTQQPQQKSNTQQPSQSVRYSNSGIPLTSVQIQAQAQMQAQAQLRSVNLNQRTVVRPVAPNRPPPPNQ